MLRSFAALCVCVVVAGVSVGQVAEGFTVTPIGPLLPGGSTTSTVVALDPVTGDRWMSNGRTLFRLDGMGGVAESIGITQSDGGPVANNSLTTDMVFDSVGRMYVNDVESGGIFRSDDGGLSWSPFASVVRPTGMEFDSAGNLWTIGDSSGGQIPGVGVNRIDPSGSVSFVSDVEGESFAFDGSGNLIIPQRAATGIDMLTPTGVLSNLFAFERLSDEVSPFGFDSIAVTPGGNFILGVNMGTGDEFLVNRGKVIRIDAVTGVMQDIAFLSPLLPVDISFTDEFGQELSVSAFGSLAPTEVTGDFDGPIVFSNNGNNPVPAPAALPAGLALVGWLMVRRRRG